MPTAWTKTWWGGARAKGNSTGGQLALLQACCAAALLLGGGDALVRRRERDSRGQQHDYVEYADYELPDNETELVDPQNWDEYSDEDWYGFELEPCLATGCTEIMLNNKDCDDACNHLECEYDLGLCFKFFDYHGYGWDFEGCYEHGCTKDMLFNDVCDEDCDSDLCHSDNWRCVSHDEYQLYDSMGNGWDEHLPMCYADSDCDEELLFNDVCDDACNTDLCHYDNWICWDEEHGDEETFHDEL